MISSPTARLSPVEIKFLQSPMAHTRDGKGQFRAVISGAHCGASSSSEPPIHIDLPLVYMSQWWQHPHDFNWIKSMTECLGWKKSSAITMVSLEIGGCGFELGPLSL